MLITVREPNSEGLRAQGSELRAQGKPPIWGDGGVTWWRDEMHRAQSSERRANPPFGGTGG
jgi:hypothetical protein